MPYKDPEKHREFVRKWRAANREKVREASQKWRTANLDKVRRTNRAYRGVNREQVHPQGADVRRRGGQVGGDEIMRRSRRPDIEADAACRIFAKPASFTGHFLIDHSFLAAEGVADFERYRVDPDTPLAPDFFVPDDSPPPPGVRIG